MTKKTRTSIDMGTTVYAYVEKKTGKKGKWELVSDNPVASFVKYVIDDYGNFKSIGFDELSDGLKKKYSDGFASFFVTDVGEIDDATNRGLEIVYSTVNTIMTALGVPHTHSASGEEIEYDGDFTGMTNQVAKELILQLQNSFDVIRNIGQRECLALILNEANDYVSEFRVIIVAA